jgi:hypothetical protein
VAEDVTLAADVHPELRPVVPGHDVRCWLYHDATGGLMPRVERAVRAGESAAEATGAAEAMAPGADTSAIEVEPG